MESVLWNVLQYNPEMSNISLVSSDWRREMNENAAFIIQGLRRSYPADTVHDSMARAVASNDIPIVSNVASITTYVPINRDDLSRYVHSRRMAEIVAIRISVDAEIEMVSRLNREGIRDISVDWNLSSADPRSYQKAYYLLLRGMYSSLSKGIVEGVIRRYGLGRISQEVRNQLYDMDYISYTELHAPMETTPVCKPKMSASEIISTIQDIYAGRGGSRIQGFNAIRDYLSNPYCVTVADADAVLKYVTPSPTLENEIRGRAIGAALVNGWDHLLDKYLNLDNILISMSSVLMKYPIHSRSWKYLSYQDMNIPWFRYYAGLAPKPSDLNPTFWKKLLANAVAVGNIPLIRNIASIHHNRIDSQMELNIMSISRKQGTYSEELMNALKQ